MKRGDPAFKHSMNPSKNKSKEMPLAKALLWIFGSAIVINGSVFLGIKLYSNHVKSIRENPNFYVATIIQTGPEKNALSSFYLAELLGLSIDKPVNLVDFDTSEAEKILKLSPVIKTASIKKLKPSSIYIDYTVRKPVASLGDFENIALDEEGVPFPIHPFFSPKSLPEVYLGLPEQYTFHWNCSIDQAKTNKAFEILKILTRSSELLDIKVQRIDVSKIDYASYGPREIVLNLEDEIEVQKNRRTMVIKYPRVLRLGLKDFEQQLGNYVELRKQLLHEEREMLKTLDSVNDVVVMPEKIIDLRIPSLAFIK